MAMFCAAKSFSSEVPPEFWMSLAKTYILFILSAIFMYHLIAYCIKSFGMYKIARSRGFNNAYLAWFPFARHYLFGKVSDDINKYKYVESSNRVVLLILSILRSILALSLCMLMFVSIGEILSAASYANPSSDYWILFLQNKAIPFIMTISIILIVGLMFNIFYCIYASNIIKDYIPKLSTLMCIIFVSNLFVLSDKLVDSIIFLSISTNQPESLKNGNQPLEYQL